MICTATTEFETSVFSELSRLAGCRISSIELQVLLIDIVAHRTAQGEMSPAIAALLRLAIKAAPYAPVTTTLVETHRTMVRACVSPLMAPVLGTIDRCVAAKIPVPAIISCKKYLPKALEVQALLKSRYFDIDPIVITGDPSVMQACFDASVLTLPVDDSYEALPAKIFETFTFLHTLGATSGVLKIDDDVTCYQGEPLQQARLAELFTKADYMGLALTHLNHDRSWHFGKCATQVPTVYGKPVHNPWANGPLYFVSGKALSLLSEHFLLFPGCIDGELYEDKAVGDVLRQFGILVKNEPLERHLGLSIDAPERPLVVAA